MATAERRHKVMTLATSEFIRRFLIHVLPKGFHRIRYYGLLAKSSCAENLVRARELLAVPKPQGRPDDAASADDLPTKSRSCPCCGGRMMIIEVFERGCQPHYQPSPIATIRIDTS